ncbi:MAG: hypothetical protein LBU73_07480 [Helicobacteraceae bacterium]|jgi:hypothetical protein|nr:hypothetical protein [Helicobacteraceae bacterium]
MITAIGESYSYQTLPQRDLAAGVSAGATADKKESRQIAPSQEETSQADRRKLNPLLAAAPSNTQAAFLTASEAVELIVSESMAAKLLEPPAKRDEEYLIRAALLRDGFANGDKEAIVRERNLALISRGLDVISPAEEAALGDRAKSFARFSANFAKFERTFLDIFIGKLAGREIKTYG